MKFLIIGGSGFLGSHVADYLTELGHQVLIYDKIESKYIKKKQKFFKGDIKNISNNQSIFKGLDYVFNFAGIADGQSKRNQQKQF